MIQTRYWIRGVFATASHHDPDTGFYYAAWGRTERSAEAALLKFLDNEPEMS